MVQNLVLVYAQLVHSQLEGVLTFLAGVPGPSGQSALHFVLTQWCSKQHLFFGSYEEKVRPDHTRLLHWSVGSTGWQLLLCHISTERRTVVEKRRPRPHIINTDS